MLLSCANPYIGKKVNKIDHYLDSQGHETVVVHTKFIVDYDYRIVNDVIHVEGIFSCREKIGGAWDRSRIRLLYYFLDQNGIILEMESVTMDGEDICQDHKFRRSFPYNSDYKAVKLSFRAQASG